MNNDDEKIEVMQSIVKGYQSLIQSTTVKSKNKKNKKKKIIIITYLLTLYSIIH